MELTNYLEAETGSKDEKLAILYQLINKCSVYVGSEALYSLSSEDYGITLDTTRGGAVGLEFRSTRSACRPLVRSLKATKPLPDQSSVLHRDD